MEVGKEYARNQAYNPPVDVRRWFGMGVSYDWVPYKTEVCFFPIYTGEEAEVVRQQTEYLEEQERWAYFDSLEF